MPDTSSILPVYVIGAGHSGTTILYRMLSMHPEMGWLSQLSQRSGTIPGRLRIPRHNQLDRWLRRRTRFDWRKEIGVLKRHVVPHPAEAARTWEYIIPTVNFVGVDESIVRLRRIIEAERSFWKKDIFIAKLPRLFEHMDVLLGAYPESRFVHIVRDGRAMAASMRHQGLLRGFSSHDALRWSAAWWCRVVKTMDEYSDTAEITTIRYEDLCTDVRGSVAELVTFCGLETSTFPFDRCPPSLTPTNDRWLVSLSPEEHAILLDEQGEYLKRFGYVASGSD